MEQSVKLYTLLVALLLALSFALGCGDEEDKDGESEKYDCLSCELDCACACGSVKNGDAETIKFQKELKKVLEEECSCEFICKKLCSEKDKSSVRSEGLNACFNIS